MGGHQAETAMTNQPAPLRHLARGLPHHHLDTMTRPTTDLAPTFLTETRQRRSR